MIQPRNLLPGQYQIGNLIFGRGTTVPVETFDIKPYDVNPQDHQVNMSDEIRFGLDSFKPTTIEITFHVLQNHLLKGYEDVIPNFWKDMPKASDFQREWRFDEGRKLWGAIKPLYCCGKDEITRMVFGRPRQFTYAKDTMFAEDIQCLGEFQRSDTFAYTWNEQYVEMAGGSLPWHLTRSGGDSPTWFRILAYGPMTNPKFTVGLNNIDLGTDIAEGEALEVSSYPWLRRAVDSNRVNLAAYMQGQSQYLDRLILPYGQDVPIRWTSEQLNTWMPNLGNQTWEQDISSLSTGPLPTYFTTLMGKAEVRYDLFNSLQLAIPPVTPSNYIGNAMFGNISAIIDNEHLFATADQYSEARITEPFYGRSAIVIMSNDTMTNYAMLEVSSGVLGVGNYLKVRTGSAPDAHGAVRTQWQNTNGLGWNETDVVGIGYDSASSTFQMYMNREPVGTPWVDATHVVNQANRHQGYIFDMDSNLLTEGTGFRNMLSFDTGGGPAYDPIEPGQYPPGPPPPGSPIGRAFLFWHDAWSTIV